MCRKFKFKSKTDFTSHLLSPKYRVKVLDRSTLTIRGVSSKINVEFFSLWIYNFWNPHCHLVFIQNYGVKFIFNRLLMYKFLWRMYNSVDRAISIINFRKSSFVYLAGGDELFDLTYTKRFKRQRKCPHRYWNGMMLKLFGFWPIRTIDRAYLFFIPKY